MPGSLTNVTDCGKYGTLQACLDAAGASGNVYIPCGTYAITTALSVYDKQTIQGAGYCTYIHNTSTGDVFDVVGTNGTHLTNVSISNLRVKAGGAASNGISLTYVDYPLVYDVYFDNGGFQDLNMSHTTYGDISKNSFVGNRSVQWVSHLYFADDTGSSIHDNKFVQSASTQGVGIATGGSNTGTRIDNNYFDTLNWGIYENGGAYIDISHNTFYNILNQGISTYGTPIVIDSNIFYNVGQSGISPQMANEVVSNNIFWKTPQAIVAAGYGYSMYGNILNGGQVSLQYNSTLNFASGNKTDLWGSYLTIANNSGANGYSGSINYNDGCSAGTATLNNFSNINGNDPWATFANVLPGDILHISNYIGTHAFQKSYYTVKSVTDAKHLLTVEPIEYPPQCMSVNYEIFRDISYIDNLGDMHFSRNAILTAPLKHTEQIIPAAVTSGSIATISATPTNGGTGYNTGDLVKVEITSQYGANSTLTSAGGTGDAIVKVATQNSGVVTSVVLVDSGSRDYTVATGWPTSALTATGYWTNGSGLTINITAVGLSVAQVSDTILVNTGQAAADITNYLPTAKAGYSFQVNLTTAESNLWGLKNNSGILNNVPATTTDLVNVIYGIGSLTGWSGANWAYNAANGGEALHTTTVTTALTSTYSCVNGQSYLATYTVYMTAGTSVTFSAGGQTDTARTAAGTYSFAFTANATTAPKFTPTADFNGAVTSVYLQPMGDLMALAGTDGVIGSGKGIKDTAAVKGDTLRCRTACIDATNSYYQWFCEVGTNGGTWAAY